MKMQIIDVGPREPPFAHADLDLHPEVAREFAKHLGLPWNDRWKPGDDPAGDPCGSFELRDVRVTYLGSKDRR